MPFVVITLPSVGTVHLSPNKKIRPHRSAINPESNKSQTQYKKLELDE
uniref:Uncharacterized protein n=1 Tax=Candidatus Kentrum sp. FM TaxID=2126340 RepID=A0A450SRZ1_9GAMM|nr:MAG: hypothetical protein BECKFM1743A_GA0114220_101731 [Candidatus Kentron sp. FM]VFK11562.1 MAG: hypothetical protein BECKFM1743B_GA0114221_101938 [Candidatus Kentron sp. FM]